MKKGPKGSFHHGLRSVALGRIAGDEDRVEAVAFLDEVVVEKVDQHVHAPPSHLGHVDLEGGEGRSITVNGVTWTPADTNDLPAAEMTEPEFNEESASNSPAQESPQKPVGNTEEPVASPDTIPQEPSEGTDTASEEPAPPDTEQEPDTTPMAIAPGSIPGAADKNMVFYQKEILLMQVLIRYGEKIICHTEDEQGEDIPLSVAEYIHYALEEDGLSFHTDLHKRILQEALVHVHDSGFSAEHYFLNHPENTVAQLAFELCDDKYQLSKYHSKYKKITSDEERLTDLVPHLMSDFKLAVVDEELQQILLKLRQPEILSNKEEYMEVMTRYKEMKDVERALARERGDRVIS